MFKFGKYAIPTSPYSKYREGRIVTSNKQSSKGIVGSKTRVLADASGSFGVGAGGALPNSTANANGTSFGSGNSGYNVDRYNPVFDQLEEGSILEDWIPRDAAGLDLLFERIYLRDPTIGPGIDIIRNLPWSDFTLDGIEDKEVLKIYQDCMDSLNVQLLMPDITRDFLVLGKQISSLIFDEKRGIFSGIVPHDPDFIRITPLPVSGFDPICDFKLSPGFKKFLTSDDPRMMDARKALPTSFLDAAKNQSGFLPLDPVSTIYLARKASTKDNIGTSLLTRTLYFWAIEKALLNAQLSSTRRRSRSFMHIKAGIDNIWEPTPEEMDALAGLVIQVNEDPVGGVIATRTGVDISEPVGGGADFYKWSDELELFAKYKMQCIGISDALLSGDATYNNAEQARSVFVETLANLRARIVNKFFMQKTFPIIARLHGFVKRSKAELDHRIRTTSVANANLPSWARMSQVTSSRLTQRKAMQIPVGDLIIPSINWAKQLKPNQDEKALEILERLKQNDYPTTLSQWAMAAGFDPKTLESDTARDADLRKKIQKMTEEAAPAEEGNLSGEEQSVDDFMKELDEGGESPAEEAPNEGETVQQSVYGKLRDLGKKTVSSMNQMAIWKNGKCGPLGKAEAAKIAVSILKENNPALLKDYRSLQSYLRDKLGEEKANVMSYCLGRLGIAKLPVDSKTAHVIASSAREVMNRHSSFNSKSALLDMRRYQSEIEFLIGYTKNKSIKKNDVKFETNAVTNELGSGLYGGVD